MRGSHSTRFQLGTAAAALSNEQKEWPELAVFIALSGWAYLRTAEIVRLYASEDVLRWEDIDFRNDRVHIRETVRKATRRAVGNERFVPMHPKLRFCLDRIRLGSEQKSKEHSGRSALRPVIPALLGYARR
jgi:hypothetical protein